MQRLLVANMFIFSVILLVVAAYSITAFARRNISVRADQIRSRYEEIQKEAVKSEVERAAARLAATRAAVFGGARAAAQQRARSALVLAAESPAAYRRILSKLAPDAYDSTLILVDPQGRIAYFQGRSTITGSSLGSSALAGLPGIAFTLDLLARGGETESQGNDFFFFGVKDSGGWTAVCVVPVAMVDAAAQRTSLAVLEKERFGVGGLGYYFIADASTRLILHPIDHSLLGRALADVTTSDGKSIGRIFEDALKEKNGSYVSYYWPSPTRVGSEFKTSYILRVQPWNWIIGSGYYLQDFNAYVDSEAAAVASAVGSTMNKQLAVLAGAAGLALLIGLYFALRVFRLERSELRRMMELERYKLLLDESALVSRTDPKGVITYVNDRFCQATGRSREDVVGKPHSVERHPSTPKDLFKNLWETIQEGHTWHGVIKNRRADGSAYFKNATILPILDEEGSVVEYIAAGQDITELVEQKGMLDRAFHTDTLTGLGSRIKLLEDIGVSVSPMVALLDISDFSRINDAYGEAAGNEVLQEFSRRLADALDRVPLASYRVYADTFALYGEGEDAIGFIKSLKGIRERIVKDPFWVSGDLLPINLRIGVACGDRDVLAYADMALGAARSRNVDLFAYGLDDESLSTELVKSVDVLKRIHGALRKDQVYPVFQPIADARSGDIVKYECLMRARDEDGVELSPGDFIPVSKKTRIYPALTRMVAEKSIRAFKDTPFEFAINITLEDLFNPATMDYLIFEARETGCIDRMVVEIVETEELVGFEEPLRTLKRFKDEGARLAIDDFGAGYSNFAYLMKLDPDYIKIDGSIVTKVAEDPRAEGLARSIVAFAKDAGIQTVAEFVKDEATAQTMRALGVDFLQGYWIGEPRPELSVPRVRRMVDPFNNSPDTP